MYLLSTISFQKQSDDSELPDVTAPIPNTPNTQSKSSLTIPTNQKSPSPGTPTQKTPSTPTLRTPNSSVNMVRQIYREKGIPMTALWCPAFSNHG